MPILRAVKDGLLDRYQAHRRELPLRRTTDPYASRVVEVTLEQTQVARVVPRYEGGPGGKVRPNIVSCVGVERP